MLHEISVAERWTSRDHDLSQSAGRRSALQDLAVVRPEHTVFSLHCRVPVHKPQLDNEETHCLLVHACWFKNNCSFGDAHVHC